MGWAIRRADGTYRAWNAATQDDALLPGEVWESMVAAPTVTAPAGTSPKLDRGVTVDDVLRWAVDELNVVRAGLPAPLPEIDVADARASVTLHSKRKER